MCSVVSDRSATIVADFAPPTRPFPSPVDKGSERPVSCHLSHCRHQQFLRLPVLTSLYSSEQHIPEGSYFPPITPDIPHPDTFPLTHHNVPGMTRSKSVVPLIQ